MPMDDVPHLKCPQCGVPLIPADEYFDGEWAWNEDECSVTTCACGAAVRVVLVDDYGGPFARAQFIEPDDDVKQ